MKMSLNNLRFLENVSPDYPDSKCSNLDVLNDIFGGENPNLMTKDQRVREIYELICADCWGLQKITSEGKSVPLINTYPLYEKIGRCFNQKHKNYIPNSQYEAERRFRKSIWKDIDTFLSNFENGESLIIHMFGEESQKWSVRATKIDGQWFFPDLQIAHTKKNQSNQSHFDWVWD